MKAWRTNGLRNDGYLLACMLSDLLHHRQKRSSSKSEAISYSGLLICREDDAQPSRRFAPRVVDDDAQTALARLV